VSRVALGGVEQADLLVAGKPISLTVVFQDAVKYL
jgi:hypothetical protein